MHVHVAGSVWIQQPFDSTDRQSCHRPDPAAPWIPIFKALNMYIYCDISLIHETDNTFSSETCDVLVT